MPRPRFQKLEKSKQEEILKVASEEFAKTGYLETSYNQIMARLDISKGAMYYYFDDKADLYSTVMQGVFEKFKTTILAVEIDATTEDSYWESMREMFLQGLAEFANDEISAALYKGILQVRYYPEVASTFGGLIEMFSSWERKILTDGQATGVIRSDLPIELLVLVFTGIAEAFDVWMVTEFLDKEPSPEVVIDTIEKQLGIMRNVFSSPNS